MLFLTNYQKVVFVVLPVVLVACGSHSSEPSAEAIQQLHLKTGPLISCGPADKEFGVLDFGVTGSEQVKKDFNSGLELLHSFEYEEAEKVFGRIIQETPGSAMAYWGVAMCSYHPLWEAPTVMDLQKGAKALEIARSLGPVSPRESGFIEAASAYYRDWDKFDARSRSIHFEKAMEALHRRFPADKEAAIFYALALDAAADPMDKTYVNQRQAGQLLNSLYPSEPNHPGIVHYLIHTYDYPGIAELGLPAAQRYAGVAPSSAHALHMPSHIFTRLGLWEEVIASNRKSVAAAACYAASAGIKGHWDEEMHGLDYLVYGYLQKGDNRGAEEELTYIRSIHEVYPVNFKGAYTFAAAPARVALENGRWQEARDLPLEPVNFPWKKFPWQEAIVHFARLLGGVHTGTVAFAQGELDTLRRLRDSLLQQKDLYKSKQVTIQIASGEAWIAWRRGEGREALQLMRRAAEMEDSTNKHPVTPGEVLPARELYGDMLLVSRQNELALQAYEAVLERSPNRFNSLYGAGVAAERAHQREKALFYYRRLLAGVDSHSDRPEISGVRAYVK